MKEFFAYFFGQGEKGEFEYFSLAHFLPLIIAGIIIFLIFKFRTQLAAYKHEDRIRLGLSFACIINEMAYFWRLVGVESLNANPVDHLPITVCGWAIIFSAFLLLTKNQTLFDIAYFWVFSGTIFALVTPAVIVESGPTRFRYYQFWLEHTLGYFAIFYMIFVHKMRPTVKSAFKSGAGLAVLAVIAIFANNMMDGANYLFLAKSSRGASILDILPKNYFVRICLMAAAMALLFYLAYLPWFLMDRAQRKKAATLCGSEGAECVVAESEMETATESVTLAEAAVANEEKTE